MSKRFVFVLMLILLVVVLGAFVGAVQSQATELPPLTEPGPYGVRLISIDFVDPSRDNWMVETHIWYPADKTIATPFMAGSPVLLNGPPDRSGAPYPLIIFSHGLGELNIQLSEVTELLASYGYVVVAPQHHDKLKFDFEPVDRPLDLMLVQDGLVAIAEGDLAGMIDTNNVGLIGYSMGGFAVLQMLGLLRDPVNYADWCAQHPERKSIDCNLPEAWGQFDFDAIAAYRAQLGLQDLPDGTWAPFGDQRIRAVMALAPGFFPMTTEDMLAAVTTPTMILMGTWDEWLDYEGNAVRTYNGLGTDDRYLISLVNQGHITFADNQDIPLHFAVAFFGDYLKGDEAYAPYLTPEGAPTFASVTLAWGPYEGE